LKLFSQAAVAIDGSKFKAVNSRGPQLHAGQDRQRKQQIDESIERYMGDLEATDRTTR